MSERHDPTGEPVAGKPHDGFGERGAETWQGERLRHRHDAKAAGKPLLPHAKASASLPDSAPVLDFVAVDQFRMDLGSGDMALDSGSEQRLGQDRRSAVNCARFAALPSLGTQCSRRPPKGRDKISGAHTATAQRQVLEAGQHLPEEARFREALIERQAYGSYADPDPHADLEQLEADRAALRPCQPCAGQAPASQSFQQHVGEVRWLRFRGHLGVR